MLVGQDLNLKRPAGLGESLHGRLEAQICPDFGTSIWLVVFLRCCCDAAPALKSGCNLTGLNLNLALDEFQVKED